MFDSPNINSRFVYNRVIFYYNKVYLEEVRNNVKYK